mmetsp:Transcript_1076/g.2153  ORF Transcript_1076/g.2153 Transcript_1076/m.2153 type:complete len:237 (+) Transcript_1076:2159-2869(+)
MSASISVAPAPFSSGTIAAAATSLSCARLRPCASASSVGNGGKGPNSEKWSAASNNRTPPRDSAADTARSGERPHPTPSAAQLSIIESATSANARVTAVSDDMYAGGAACPAEFRTFRALAAAELRSLAAAACSRFRPDASLSIPTATRRSADVMFISSEVSVNPVCESPAPTPPAASSPPFSWAPAPYKPLSYSTNSPSPVGRCGCDDGEYPARAAASAAAASASSLAPSASARS